MSVKKHHNDFSALIQGQIVQEKEKTTEKNRLYTERISQVQDSDIKEFYCEAHESLLQSSSKRLEILTNILSCCDEAILEPLVHPTENHLLIYSDCLYEVKGAYSYEEKKLLILEFADKERQQFERLKAKFSGEQAKIATVERKRIPEDVRIAVWRRDQGQCARCTSRENLEYDHIIPHSRGGSTTVRNIELLCERCNREKGDRIQ